MLKIIVGVLIGVAISTASAQEFKARILKRVIMNDATGRSNSFLVTEDEHGDYKWVCSQ